MQLLVSSDDVEAAGRQAGEVDGKGLGKGRVGFGLEADIDRIVAAVDLDRDVPIALDRRCLVGCRWLQRDRSLGRVAIQEFVDLIDNVCIGLVTPGLGQRFHCHIGAWSHLHRVEPSMPL
ncbi:MAG: hypothetical protein OEU92_12285 [Alphaproteobacteria bacterium]|nr:hypothetical protein [Alphaproteobacteria bacterium]